MLNILKKTILDVRKKCRTCIEESRHVRKRRNRENQLKGDKKVKENHKEKHIQRKKGKTIENR